VPVVAGAGHSGHFGAIRRPSKKPSTNSRISASIHGHLRFLRAGSVDGATGVPQPEQKTVSGVSVEPQLLQMAFTGPLGFGISCFLRTGIHH